MFALCVSCFTSGCKPKTLMTFLKVAFLNFWEKLDWKINLQFCGVNGWYVLNLDFSTGMIFNL